MTPFISHKLDQGLVKVSKQYTGHMSAEVVESHIEFGLHVVYFERTSASSSGTA